MKTLKLFFLSVLGFLQFASQFVRCALIFASAFLGNEPHWDVNWLPSEQRQPDSA